MKFKSMSSNQKAWLWLLQFVLLMITLAYIHFTQPLKLNADLVSLFETKKHAHLSQITEQFEAKNLEKQIILVGSQSLDEAITKADELTRQLTTLSSVKNVKSNFADLPSLSDIIEQLLPYKHFLLSEQYRELLQQGDEQPLFAYQFSLLNQLADQSVALTVQNDPTLSLAGFVSRPLINGSSLTLKKDHLVAQYQNKFYTLISFSSKSSSVDIDAAQKLTQELKKLTHDSEVEYLYTGAIFYASKASQVGQYEMMLYGGISLIATLLLIILVYRSLTALLATSILILISFIYGYLALNLFYDQISIITFVFSITLIGIAADYSFHALTELRFGQTQIASSQTNRHPLSEIVSSLSMSYITTGAGYALLLFAPFILFQQIALFTLFGLFGALLTVLLLYPVLLPLIHKAPSAHKKAAPEKSQYHFQNLPVLIVKINQLQQLMVNFISRQKLFFWIFFILSFGLLGLISFNDDIRKYYAADEELQTKENQVKTILRTKWDLQYFLVEGNSEQAVLEAEEKLLIELQDLLAKKELTGISAISMWLPSFKKQSENLSLIEQAQATGRFKKMSAILSQSDWRLNSDNSLLQPQQWLASHLGHMYQGQWLQQSQNFYSLVRLAGIKNLARLNDIADSQQQVVFIDKAQTISIQLNQFRQELLVVLIAAIFAALLVFIWRYGINVALIGLLTPIFALISAFFISSVIQQQLNIFNLVAGILILALGLDYSVYYAEHGFQKKITLTTLTSALSSIFVFAILMLSSMPAIKSFGLTVFIGILVTFMFAPIVTQIKRRK